MGDYPRFMFHPSAPWVIVRSAEEEQALGPDWTRTVQGPPRSSAPAQNLEAIRAVAPQEEPEEPRPARNRSRQMRFDFDLRPAVHEQLIVTWPAQRVKPPPVIAPKPEPVVVALPEPPAAKPKPKPRREYVREPDKLIESWPWLPYSRRQWIDPLETLHLGREDGIGELKLDDVIAANQELEERDYPASVRGWRDAWNGRRHR